MAGSCYRSPRGKMLMFGSSTEATSGKRRRNVPPDASNLCVSQSSDALPAIVAGCQQGDRTAQEGLYHACRERVWRVAVRMVGAQDAADVTQQVFLQAFRTIGQFQGQSRIETWLYRLTVNECLQLMRRNRQRRTAALEWEPVDRAASRRGDEDREALDWALARLDPQLRSIFILKEIEELSYREIAEAVQIPEGTVGSRLNRARGELKLLLAGIGCQTK